MAESVHYVYAVVEAASSLDGAPPGIDATPVELHREGDVAAVVSTLDAATYGGSDIDARTGDLEWLGPRARAHDEIVTWVSDRGAAVPLPMFTMFRDSAGVTAMLRERRVELGRGLERVRGQQEFGVRLFRIDDALTAYLAELSPRIAELERSAAAASPGQRYLLTRKIEAERASELRRIGAEVAQGAYDALSAHASAAVLDTLPQRTPAGMAGVAVLNASFLLRRTSLDAFRRALTALIEAHGTHGFRFEFTGPWPPYHFVQEAQGEL